MLKKFWLEHDRLNTYLFCLFGLLIQLNVYVCYYCNYALGVENLNYDFSISDVLKIMKSHLHWEYNGFLYVY